MRIKIIVASTTIALLIGVTACTPAHGSTPEAPEAVSVTPLTSTYTPEPEPEPEPEVTEPAPQPQVTEAPQPEPQPVTEPEPAPLVTEEPTPEPELPPAPAEVNDGARETWDIGVLECGINAKPAIDQDVHGNWWAYCEPALID